MNIETAIILGHVFFSSFIVLVFYLATRIKNDKQIDIDNKSIEEWKEERKKYIENFEKWDRERKERPEYKILENREKKQL